MMREEFEKIAGAEISSNLYENIERLYARGNEDKFGFIGRVFGYKNTTKSIAVKYALYLIRDNRDAFGSKASPERLREMDESLIDYVTWLAGTESWGKRVRKWEFDLFGAKLGGKKAFVWESAAAGGKGGGA
jgi:hypothetical protein